MQRPDAARGFTMRWISTARMTPWSPRRPDRLRAPERV